MHVWKLGSVCAVVLGLFFVAGGGGGEPGGRMTFKSLPPIKVADMPMSSAGVTAAKDVIVNHLGGDVYLLAGAAQRTLPEKKKNYCALAKA